MTDFIRPALNAVTSVDELTIGTKLYHVYGIWPPFIGACEYEVVKAPFQSPDHGLMFETKVDDHRDTQFASDGNIGCHYNNNYWFKTTEDAEIYRAQCCEDWESHPEEIERVQDRRRHMYDYDYDDNYY